jgi:hypothetical protein
MHVLREFASSGTSSPLGNKFLVTLGGCHPLDGLEHRGSLNTLLVIVGWLQSIDCEGYYAYVVGDWEEQL